MSAYTPEQVQWSLGFLHQVAVEGGTAKPDTIIATTLAEQRAEIERMHTVLSSIIDIATSAQHQAIDEADYDASLEKIEALVMSIHEGYPSIGATLGRNQ